MKEQVRFGKEIFKKTLDDYANWEVAIVRELVQNSIDSGAKRIEIETGDNKISCKDNGSGMSEEVLREALLTICGTHKEEESEGGFGRAKELLLFAHPKWEVVSNGYKVSGSYIDFDFEPVSEPIKGTVVTIWFENFNPDTSHYLSSCMFDGVRIFLNGERVRSRFSRLREIGSLNFARILAKKSRAGCLHVIGRSGLLMFSRPLYDVSAIVVVKLTVPSIDVCTTNRDGLKWSYRDEVEMLVSSIYEKKRQFVRNDAKVECGFVSGVANPSDFDGFESVVSQFSNFVGFDWFLRLERRCGVKPTLKTKRLLILWNEMLTHFVDAMKRENLISEDRKVVPGIIDSKTSAGSCRKVDLGSKVVVSFNPRHFRGFSRGVVGLVLHDVMLHEMAHLFTTDEGDVLHGWESRIEKALFKNWKMAKPYRALITKKTWS